MALIKTPFGFSSTALEVAAGIDLSGRRAVVTGAASGIGVETARALASTGAEVTLAVRDVEAGAVTAKDIVATTGNDKVSVARLDLTDLASVRAFAADWQGPLHLLINNAGVMASPEEYTPQGWELQFATNHLGHFALANGMHDALAADGITANALMPGAILTNLQRHTGGRGTGTVPPELFKSTAQGAATSVLLAVSPLLEGIGGRYFDDCNEAEVVDRRTGTLHGVARYALDPATADRLWDVSLNLTTT